MERRDQCRKLHLLDVLQLVNEQNNSCFRALRRCTHLFEK